MAGPRRGVAASRRGNWPIGYEAYLARDPFPMRELRVGLLALVVALSTSAAAQEWPSRPVRFVGPFTAGGSTDVGARLVGESLSRRLHQQIVVENKSGANGNIGIEAAAKSPADGYTILVATDAVSSNPHVYRMNIDPLRELVPVIQLSRQPMVLAAHASLGIGSLAELIALAREQPGLHARSVTGSMPRSTMRSPKPPCARASCNPRRSRAAARPRNSRASFATNTTSTRGWCRSSTSKRIDEAHRRRARDAGGRVRS